MSSYPSEMIDGTLVYSVPVSKVYEALKEENGHVDLIREEWFSYGRSERDDSGLIVGACILGQGSINMGIASDGSNATTRIPIIKNTYTDLLHQLNRFAVPETSKWYDGNSKGVGETIIRWNDKRADTCTYKEHGRFNDLTHSQMDWDALFNSENEDDWAYAEDQQELCEFGYALPTYNDVLEMAHDLLEPYFNQTVFLAAYDWKTV